jgi:hypothetical protein
MLATWPAAAVSCDGYDSDQDPGGLRALPGLLEGSAICVVTRNRQVAGFNCPVVDHIEAT